MNNKKQYIDRQELLRFFTISPSGERYRLKNIDGFPVEVQLEAVQKRIREVPIIDAVEVVRCKDCAWKDTESHGLNIWCEENRRYVYGDDYCSRGERI